MPGPRNMKKKAKHEAKKARRSQSDRPPDNELNASEKSSAPIHNTDRHASAFTADSSQIAIDCSLPYDPPVAAPNSSTEAHPDPLSAPASYEQPPRQRTIETHEHIPPSLTTEPFIYDPGNGPRVRDVSAFLGSSFAALPSLDDPLCAEFAQEEMLEMLCSVLPQETALILWYNKSRRSARVCPACQRLYRLGDVLPEHLLDENSIPRPHEPIAPYLIREQQLSGLCSPMCFVLAAFNYPGTIRSAWGRMAEELDAETWDLLDGPGTSAVKNDRGLGMLLKMTRCTDLGLAEMFFPDEELPVDAVYDDYEVSDEEDYGVDSFTCGGEESSAMARLDGGCDFREQQGPDALVRNMDVLSLAA